MRAVNEARLVSVAASVGVHISPRTRLTVWDGNRQFDVNYQNDLSSISGQVGREKLYIFSREIPRKLLFCCFEIFRGYCCDDLSLRGTLYR